MGRGCNWVGPNLNPDGQPQPKLGLGLLRFGLGLGLDFETQMGSCRVQVLASPNMYKHMYNINKYLLQVSPSSDKQSK